MKIKGVPLTLEPHWTHLDADGLYQFLDRAGSEFGGRVLLVLNRKNHRHVEKLLRKLRKQGRELPCAVLLKRSCDL